MPNKFLAILIIIAFSFLLIFRDAEHASSILIVPDSTEYITMAVNFLTQGTTKIEIDGNWHPSRYTPWFSMTVLMPALAVFGAEPGQAIYGIFAANILGLISIYFLLRRLVNPIAALAGTLTFLVVSDYTKYAQVVMNDSLSGLIFVIIFLLFVSEKEKIFDHQLKGLFLGGLIALAYLWRVSNLALILPFCFILCSVKKPFKLSRLTFIAPILCALILNSLYSFYNFGSIFRNGYNYWTSIPYDYPELTFNWTYLKVNSSTLWNFRWTYLLLLPIPLVLYYWKKAIEVPAIIIFYLLALLPVCLFYLFYFFFDVRFHLPIFLVPITGAILTLKYLPKYVSGIYLAIIVTAIISVANSTPIRNYFPAQLMNIEAIRAKTDSKAIVITNLDPLYLNLFFRNDSRKFIPIDRQAEYASKIISPVKTPNLSAAEIKSPYLHRHPKALLAGIEPIKYVFADNPLQLSNIPGKQEIYLDLYQIPGNNAKIYLDYTSQFFNLESLGKRIYRLSRKP